MLTLIENADIYAPEPRGPGCLLAGGGKVLYLGREAPALDGSLPHSIIDGRGCRLIPGLVDAHVHVTGGGGEGGFSSRVPQVGLSRFILNGVTTVVGLLGADDETRSTAELLARIRALREEGLSAWCWTGGYHLPPATLTGSVRKDIVHIDCVIGAGEVALSDHRSSQPTFDELARLASEVHTAGMISGKAGVLHLHLGDGERGLELVRRLLAETEIPPRVFHPTHVNRKKALFDEACDLSRKGVTIDLTAYPVEREDEWSAEDAWLLYHARGCPGERITISSDAGGCIPSFDPDGRLTEYGVGTPASLLHFLRELTHRGSPLESVLPAVTSNVSRLLRLDDKGWLGPGADADLALVDEDFNVVRLMAGGHWMVEDGAAVAKGTFET